MPPKLLAAADAQLPPGSTSKLVQLTEEDLQRLARQDGNRVYHYAPLSPDPVLLNADSVGITLAQVRGNVELFERAAQANRDRAEGQGDDELRTGLRRDDPWMDALARHTPLIWNRLTAADRLDTLTAYVSFLRFSVEQARLLEAGKITADQMAVNGRALIQALERQEWVRAGRQLPGDEPGAATPAQ